METMEMGRVTTDATIYNLGDLIEVRRGTRTAEQVRKVEVKDALVDSGATNLCLPPSLIHALGLSKWGEKRETTAGGVRMLSVYDAVRLEIMGRDATVDVIETPEEAPVLVGQLPLEAMDWVIDMRARRLIGNPAHGGEHVIEVFGIDGTR